MNGYTWKDDVLSRIKEIEQQRSDIVNILQSVPSNTHSIENTAFEVLVIGIVRFIGYHFRCEEELMIRGEYAGFSRHKEAHGQLTSQIARSLGKMRACSSVELAHVATSVKADIFSHIAQEDLPMLRSIRASSESALMQKVIS